MTRSFPTIAFGIVAASYPVLGASYDIYFIDRQRKILIVEARFLGSLHNRVEYDLTAVERFDLEVTESNSVDRQIILIMKDGEKILLEELFDGRWAQEIIAKMNRILSEINEPGSLHT